MFKITEHIQAEHAISNGWDDIDGRLKANPITSLNVRMVGGLWNNTERDKRSFVRDNADNPIMLQQTDTDPPLRQVWFRPEPGKPYMYALTGDVLDTHTNPMSNKPVASAHAEGKFWFHKMGKLHDPTPDYAAVQVTDHIFYFLENDFLKLRITVPRYEEWWRDGEFQRFSLDGPATYSVAFTRRSPMPLGIPSVAHEDIVEIFNELDSPMTIMRDGSVSFGSAVDEMYVLSALKHFQNVP